jgi:diacylglycerol kinase (ATP)
MQLQCNKTVTATAYRAGQYHEAPRSGAEPLGQSQRMESPHKGRTGLRRIWNALFYSLDGFVAAYRHENAFRQEVWLSLILVPLAFFIPVSNPNRMQMIASVLLVLIVELLNSGIEAVTDRVSLEDHRLAKRAKDLGSAAVMLSLVNVTVVWLMAIFG